MKKGKDRKKSGNQGFIDIYGYHAVRAALKNPDRNHQKLVISERNKDLISKEIKRKIQNIFEMPRKEINKSYGSESIHQGIILTTTILNQPTIRELLYKSKKKEIEIIVMLDQVTDPNNIGAIIRSCSLFNCSAIIVSKDNAPDITSSIIKVASGGIETVHYIKVTNLVRTIKDFKKNNFWIYALDNNKKNLINKFDFPKKCLLILGSEGKGIRDLTKKECDEIISIPINKNNKYQIDSLNVSNACSIALYEYYKKNNK